MQAGGAQCGHVPLSCPMRSSRCADQRQLTVHRYRTSPVPLFSTDRVSNGVPCATYNPSFSSCSTKLVIRSGGVSHQAKISQFRLSNLPSPGASGARGLCTAGECRLQRVPLRCPSLRKPSPKLDPGPGEARRGGEWDHLNQRSEQPKSTP